MRYIDILTERAESKFYVHVTKRENVRSILKQGLIPNHANNGTGRYEDARWYTLDGIYATNSAPLAIKIIESLGSAYALVVLAITPTSTLPDEDVIDMLMDKAYERVRSNYGIDDFFQHDPSTHFDNRSQAPDYEPHENDLRDTAHMWEKVAEEFHHLACHTPKIAFNRDLLDDLVDYWRTWEVEEYQDGDNDPHYWKDLKDKIVRKYRKMAINNLQHYTSVRIPNPVTFRGRNRIVAIVDSDGSILYGMVPEAAQALIDGIVR